MRKSYTLKKTNLIPETEKDNMKIKLEPKQSTIDFLKSFSRVLYVEKLQGEETVELILN